MKQLRMLLLCSLALLSSGGLLYYRGSELNLQVQTADEMLWNGAPGDKWLYVGGVMMLIAGALAFAAVKVWLASRSEARSSTLIVLRDR